MLIPKLTSSSIPTKSLTTPIVNKNEPVIDPDLPQSQSLTTFLVSRRVDLVLPDLPMFTDSSISDYNSLIYAKIGLCKEKCDFTRTNADLEAKAIKMSTLSELSLMIETEFFFQFFTSNFFAECYNMLFQNIYRNISIDPSFITINGDSFSFLEPSWEHLSGVYEFANKLQYISSYYNVIPKHILKLLIYLLDSPDYRERESIFTLLYAYLKFHPMESNNILKNLLYVLYEYIESPISFYSVQIVLRLLIASREFNIDFLEKQYEIVSQIILLLSSSSLVVNYFTLLLSLFEVMITINRSFSYRVVHWLLKRFPVSSINHQVINLMMLSKLYEYISIEQFDLLFDSFLFHYSMCAQSTSIKVIEESCKIWQNNKMRPLIIRKSDKLISVLFPIIKNAIEKHWSTKAKPIGLSVFRVMREINEKLFEQLHNKSIVQYDEPKKITWELLSNIYVQ